MDKEKFLAMIAAGRDSALLRLTLGNLYLDEDDAANAAVHLRQAVILNPRYSAAWKMLGKALLALGRDDDAEQAWRAGVEAAQAQGNVQTVKEMQVLLRRLDKKRHGAG